MKQPELGQTILRIRQQKHMTQEELVEKCNINVRTLQRIESGEVTPRDYTIKTILEALDHDFDAVINSINRSSSLSKLQLAWIAGIIYFILGLAESVVEFMRFDTSPSLYFPLIYTTIKAFSLVTFIFFMIGFVEVGRQFQNYLLRISAFLMMGVILIVNLYDIISILQSLTEKEFWSIKAAEGIAFGGVDIIFGFALTRLEQLGIMARVAGILEIIAGLFFITAILGFVGLFVLIPATILEVVILYKAYEMMSASQ